MPILKITVENADELLNSAMLGTGALGRVERSATGGGAGFSEVTTFAIVAGTRIYTVYDLSGTTSSWYRVRFSKADGTSPTDYGPEFQAGGEEGGLLCSLYDVKQRLGFAYTDSSEDENILEYIRQASAFIEGETERWFAPRPSSGTATYLLSPTVTGRRVEVPKGIRSVTAIGYATTDQPDTGGTYTTITASEAVLTPSTIERTPGWPATGIQLLSTSAGSFYAGLNTVTVTGSFGWEAVPADVGAAAADLAVILHRGRADGGIGGSVIVNVDGSRTYDRLPTSVYRVLMHYRRRVVG
jgi:hypothetical protein